MTRRRARLAALAGSLVLATGLAGCASVVGVTDAPTATVGGAVSGTRAATIAAQVVETAQKAAATPGADGDALRAAAYSGDALIAAKADAKLAGLVTQEQKDALALTSQPPVVLAVSSGLSYPRTMLVQTTRAKSGLPVLYLMTTPDVRTPFTIAATAQMLPSAVVPALNQVAQGAPDLGDGAGLAVDPEKLLAAYAASLAYPVPAAADRSPFSDDAYAARVEASAKDQAAKLGDSGSFTQQHSAKDVTGGLRLSGGQGALAFGVMDRKDTILNRSQQPLNTTPGFKALTGLDAVRAEATSDTLEFVVFVIPESGSAQVVAAEDHLVSASGT